jgi:acyl-CoA thioesterase-1
MPRPLCVLALSLCLLLSACSDSPRLPPLQPQARILAFGDSLTFGTGASPEQSYPAVLAGLLGLEVVNAGVPGELSAAGLARLPGLLDELQPSLLILCHGGNDILRGQDLERARGNLEAMVREAKARGIGVVLVGVPARQLLADTAGFYRAVAESNGLPLEDEVIGEIILRPSLKSDAVHPNAAGYRRLAEAVHQVLREAGAVN